MLRQADVTSSRHRVTIASAVQTATVMVSLTKARTMNSDVQHAAAVVSCPMKAATTTTY
jgi:hypothetical protein